MKLLVAGRREDRLSMLKDELNHTAVFPCDITESEIPERLLQTALDTFGQCDIVFNNAGIISVGSIDEINIEDICYMVRVNVEAAFRMAYVAVKHFKSAGSGFLINTSNVLGTKVRPTAGAYAGTKFAMEALTEALRLGLAKTDIAVACVEPGLVQTELHKNWEVPPAQSLGIPRPCNPRTSPGWCDLYWSSLTMSVCRAFWLSRQIMSFKV